MGLLNEGFSLEGRDEWKEFYYYYILLLSLHENRITDFILN